MNRLGSRWNGRGRYAHEPFVPFCVLHDTESSSARSTFNYFLGLTETNKRRIAQDKKPKYAGYHCLFDFSELIRMGSAGGDRMYGAAVGGNDGFHLSGAYFKADWVAGELDKPAWLRRFAEVLRVVEAADGFRVDRVYSGDFGEGLTYRADRKENCRRGFYFHGDVDPRWRSDPGWDRRDVEMFLGVLAGLDSSPTSVAAPVDDPWWVGHSEVAAAVDAGLTDGSRLGEPALRAEAAVMALRAAKLPPNG